MESLSTSELIISVYVLYVCSLVSSTPNFFRANIIFKVHNFVFSQKKV